jgi:phosphoenolpyruvate carboxykinase (GTP)
MRCHGEVDAMKTPTGLIPEYDILARLFKDILDEDYTRQDYEYQFSFRCSPWQQKLERAIRFYQNNAADCPKYAFDKWQEAIEVIKAARGKYGDVIKPGNYKG